MTWAHSHVGFTCPDRVRVDVGDNGRAVLTVSEGGGLTQVTFSVASLDELRDLLDRAQSQTVRLLMRPDERQAELWAEGTEAAS